MKPKNPKLMLALGGIGVIVFIGFTYALTHGSASTPSTAPTSGSVSSYDIESGDTNTEVLKTLIANQKVQAKRDAELAAKNQQLQAEATQNQSQQVSKVQSVLTEQLNSLQAQLQSQKQSEQNQTQTPPPTQTSGYAINGDSTTPITTPDGSMIGTVGDISSAFIVPSPNGSTPAPTAQVYGAAPATPPTLPSDSASAQQNAPKLMYSIPDGATIGSVYMMTATLAEVPVSGHLIAPAWPFKAIVGRQDLLGTNGQMLPPQISGAIIQGHAIGNMGMSCANLYVDKITYTFNDGHFWVYPADTGQSTTQGTQVYPSNTLGFLSLPDGTQCINGLHLTDAPQILTNLTILGAASNAGNVMANQQLSTVSNMMTGQTTNTLTGSAGKLIGWSAVAGGSTAALNYYQQRVSDVFDAIFLPSSTNNQPTKLTFNVQQTIPIDYDPTAMMDSSKGAFSGQPNNLD